FSTPPFAHLFFSLHRSLFVGFASEQVYVRCFCASLLLFETENDHDPIFVIFCVFNFCYYGRHFISFFLLRTRNIRKMLSTPTGGNLEEGAIAFHHRQKLMERGRVFQRLPQHNQIALWVQTHHHSAATDHCWLNVANSSSLWSMVPVPFDEINCSGGVGCRAMFEFPTPMIASIMPPST
ncbi:GPI-anchored surface protein, putative, partial [Bodo saltans]